VSPWRNADGMAAAVVVLPRPRPCPETVQVDDDPEWGGGKMMHS